MHKFYSFLIFFLFNYLPAQGMYTGVRVLSPRIAHALSKDMRRGIFSPKPLFSHRSETPKTALTSFTSHKAIAITVQPQMQQRLFSWFKNHAICAQKHADTLQKINAYITDLQGALLGVDDDSYNTVLRTVGALDSQYVNNPATKHVLFKLVAATGFESNPLCVPWFYNANDIEKEMHKGLDRQKMLMQVLLNKKFDVSCVVTDAHNNDVALPMHAVKSLNVGALMVCANANVIDTSEIKKAIDYLTREFANLADKNKWLKSRSYERIEYDRGKDFVIKIILDVLQPGLSAQYIYTGPTSDNAIKSKKEDVHNKTHKPSQSCDQSKHVQYLHEFYELAMTTIKPSAERVLGVSALSTKQEIKEAYMALMQKYHPDKQCDDESRKKATVVAQLINTAYSALLQRK